MKLKLFNYNLGYCSTVRNDEILHFADLRNTAVCSVDRTESIDE